MSSSEKPTAAFVLSLFAGILILINGAVLGAIAPFLPIMLAATGEAGALPIVANILTTLMIIGIILGIIIIFAAVMLYRNPIHKTLSGIVILILSLISIFIGGGFIIGLILGIIGGILSLTWKPKTSLEVS